LGAVLGAVFSLFRFTRIDSEICENGLKRANFTEKKKPAKTEVKLAIPLRTASTEANTMNHNRLASFVL